MPGYAPRGAFHKALVQAKWSFKWLARVSNLIFICPVTALMRTIKTYFKRAPFYNALIRTQGQSEETVSGFTDLHTSAP